MITQIFQTLLGRVPVGWLQLQHNKARFTIAVLGVTFANLLLIVQIGIMNSMSAATIKPYEFFSADIMISAQDANTLREGENVSRQWLVQAFEHPDVVSAMRLYVAQIVIQKEDKNLNVTAFGVDPSQPTYLADAIGGQADFLHIPKSAILDQKTRGLSKLEVMEVSHDNPLEFHTFGRKLLIEKTFEGGGGFGSDGYLMLSDQSFLGLLRNRKPESPDHILVKVRRNTDPEKIAYELQGIISNDRLRIRTYQTAALEELEYQQKKRPTGVIFGFGVIMGILVGFSIIYQVLSAEVNDHLSEYATLKAIGYSYQFLLGIIIEEAVILAVIGFSIGVTLSSVLLSIMAAATSLQLEVTVELAVLALLGTTLSCAFSGVIATRRLIKSDPGELF